MISTTQGILRPPLAALPNMTNTWSNGDWHFDAGADQLVQAHVDNGVTHDLAVSDLRTWRVRGSDGLFALEAPDNQGKPYRLRTGALADFAGRIGAPAEFVRERLPERLQLATANYLLSHHSKPLPATLRLRNRQVTAVVSPRYAPLEPQDLVATLRSALVTQGLLEEVRVRAVAVGTTDLLRLTLPSRQQAIRIGDISACGLDISSSCFGRSAVHVRAMIWRLVCLNGLRTVQPAGAFSIRHVGEPKRLRTSLASAIPRALEHLGTMMDQWYRAVDVMVENVGAEVDNLRGLTLPEQQRVRAEITQEGEQGILPERIDLYRFVNSMTAAAHASPPARRLELEGFAGQVLQRHAK